jgi:putative transposase
MSLYASPRSNRLSVQKISSGLERVAVREIISHSAPSSGSPLFRNHAKQIAAIDFFTVPIVTFRNSYCFIILLHDRRQVIHFNVTAHPTAEWTARQLIEAFQEDSAPRHSTASKGNAD